MTKKTRLIILIFCVVCFFIVAPVLVAYSMGYRFDLKKMQVTETGGIYVRTFPAADKITIDSKISEKPGIFSNDIFVQSLLPESHTVSIEKAGYYDYSKTLAVQEEQVTKLENVLLIKKNIAFSDFASNIDYFSASPNNQNILASFAGAKSTTFNYFYLNSTNPAQTFSIPLTATISNIQWSGDSSKALIEAQKSGNDYYYLFDTTLPKPAATRLSYLDKNSQQISFDPQDSNTIFYTKNKINYSAKGNVSVPIIANTTVATAKIIKSPLTGYKVLTSGDNQNSIYWNNNEIYLYPATTLKLEKLYSGSQIANVQWLNNSNIIFTDADKIIISEIDYRGNINIVTLPQTGSSTFFDQANGKLYVLSGNSLLVSEKITP